MSCFYVIGFGLKVGRLLLMLCCWLVSVISMNWFIIVGLMDSKRWLKLWEKILENTWKIHHHYYQYIVGKKVRRTWWRKLLVIWVVLWTLGSFSMFCYMSSQAVEKRKETLASMCDERARMLQDQFNVIMNHVQNMSILISTFHHEKNPSSIDQVYFDPSSSLCGV
ncbi:Histidine kinase [Actinidia chinensis var. chinensis]|uniref:Histidine kinase n=1 Tax=Actinidia chinensis var. chinensis TaxID=1590841 RepID=A0A2R6R3F1_ACTCC|nr:Histidine kinase [Actinidia chinensis var. chinensis]